MHATELSSLREMKGDAEMYRVMKTQEKSKAIYIISVACGIDNQEITGQIKNNFVVSNAFH